VLWPHVTESGRRDTQLRGEQPTERSMSLMQLAEADAEDDNDENPWVTSVTSQDSGGVLQLGVQQESLSKWDVHPVRIYLCAKW
jgi:hypothetical protein